MWKRGMEEQGKHGDGGENERRREAEEGFEEYFKENVREIKRKVKEIYYGSNCFGNTMLMCYRANKALKNLNFSKRESEKERNVSMESW